VISLKAQAFASRDLTTATGITILTSDAMPASPAMHNIGAVVRIGDGVNDLHATARTLTLWLFLDGIFASRFDFPPRADGAAEIRDVILMPSYPVLAGQVVTLKLFSSNTNDTAVKVAADLGSHDIDYILAFRAAEASPTADSLVERLKALDDGTAVVGAKLADVAHGGAAATITLQTPVQAALANAAHGGAAATLTLQTPVEADLRSILGVTLACKGNWANSTAYAAGDLVFDSTGTLYQVCATGHTSSAAPATFAEDRAAHPTWWAWPTPATVVLDHLFLSKLTVYDSYFSTVLFGSIKGGAVEITDLTGGALTFTGGLTVGGEVLFQSDIFFGGTTHFTDIEVDGDLVVTGDVTGLVVTLANAAHGGAAATITLATPIAATVPDAQKVDVNTIKTKAVTVDTGGTTFAGTVASPTNITAATGIVLANAAHGGAAATLTLQTPVEANAVEISGDAAAADRLEAEFDGTAAAAAGVWYVSKSGNDANDGRSWQTAKLTIGAAVVATAAGATIRIGPGTYVEAVDASAKANLTLEGAGYSTIIAPAAGTALILGEQGTVRRMALVGVVSGLYAHGVSRVRAEKCYIGGTSAAFFHDVFSLLIEDCYLLGSVDAIIALSCNDATVYRSTACGRRFGISAGNLADEAGSPLVLRVEKCTVYAAGYTADSLAVAVQGDLYTRTLILDSDLKVVLPAGAVDPWQARAVEMYSGVVSRSRLYAESSAAGGEAFGVWTGGGTGVLVHACSIQTVCSGTAKDLYASGGQITVSATLYNTAKTSGTIVQAPTDTSIAGYTSSRATKLDNLNATVGSRSSHSAADVWAVGTRTLTSFGTLVVDVAAAAATAVWAAAARTLTAFGFTVTGAKDGVIDTIAGQVDVKSSTLATPQDVRTTVLPGTLQVRAGTFTLQGASQQTLDLPAGYSSTLPLRLVDDQGDPVDLEKAELVLRAVDAAGEDLFVLTEGDGIQTTEAEDGQFTIAISSEQAVAGRHKYELGDAGAPALYAKGDLVFRPTFGLAAEE